MNKEETLKAAEKLVIEKTNFKPTYGTGKLFVELLVDFTLQFASLESERIATNDNPFGGVIDGGNVGAKNTHTISDEEIEKQAEKTAKEYPSVPQGKIDYFNGFSQGAKWLRSKIGNKHTDENNGWISVEDIEKIRLHASALQMIGEFGEFSINDDDAMIDDIVKNSKEILKLLPNKPNTK